MDKDVFTSIVRVKGSDKYKVVSVKSSEEVDKKLWVELSKVLGRIYVNIPINSGDIICKNILNTGINIICTRTLEQE
ncbi:DUF1667 domain-containing protein [Clostridium septicum]|uniref:DUF1667 domain-containing protein n=1 Tax=Clostridium septicum TaxID=1504 RepID=A0A9N7JM14_CLOSE|nr:DUF1667 domain-containing protein [Clostridium septicum]AYE34341.1 DUF1667 domain-containing protein [Clostridium septicum]MDU1314297.1 DUF1667 domain-containing protein [Clostridium septicum]QAS59737.1 DUF1667 domain-containing protein [Clostridium septicum]UEC21021.1 DUF1667 domain-containing protein [Clostridium septicum]USS00930.1 DUF1667 domain-containing protein [Clostridium septicum]